MGIVLNVFFVALGLLALSGRRWAFAGFVVAGLLYFPVHAGFHFVAPVCEGMPDLRLAAFSLTNYGHVIRFAWFFLLTRVQFRTGGWKTNAASLAIGLLMGALVELDEGITGSGHCRLRDLVPDAAGALIGLAVFELFRVARTSVRGGGVTPLQQR